MVGGKESGVMGEKKKNCTRREGSNQKAEPDLRDKKLARVKIFSGGVGSGSP